MKLARMLFILLIGMISFTTLANTPMPEQKPKTITEMFVKTDVTGVVFTAYENVLFVNQKEFIFQVQKKSDQSINYCKTNFNYDLLPLRIPLIDNRNYVIIYKEKDSNYLLRPTKIPLDKNWCYLGGYNYVFNFYKNNKDIGIKDSKRYIQNGVEFSII